DIGLVLVIGEYDLDVLSEHLLTEILERQPRRDDVAWSLVLTVWTRCVMQNSDLDLSVSRVSRRGERQRSQYEDGTCQVSHCVPPMGYLHDSAVSGSAITL